MRSIIFLIFLSGAVRPQNPTIQVTADKDRLGVGEMLTYTITISCPDKVRILSEPITSFNDLEVSKIQKFEPVSENGITTQKYEYDLTSFKLDTFMIGKPGVLFLSGRDTLFAEGLVKRIIFHSVLDTSVKDIRPEKPLIAGKINWTILLAYIAGALIAISVLTYLGIKYYRKYKARRIQKASEMPVITRTPEEIAIESLESLRDRRLIDKGEVKLFHIDVSNIIRLYVEQRFKTPALEMPTSDLIGEFRRRKLTNDSYVAFLRRFLEVCDLVKFAKYQASPAESAEVLEQAFDLVKMNLRNVDNQTNERIPQKV